MLREAFWPMVTLPLAILIIGCAGFPAAAGGSLYARLGGMAQIEMIVDETVSRTAANARIDSAFAAGRLPALKRGLSVQVCALSGGPCTQEVHDFHAADGDTKLNRGEFDIIVGNMRTVLERRVGEREKNEVLRLLAPVRRSIVGA